MKQVQLAMASEEININDGELKLPIIIKDKVLLTPGQWNGLNFTDESIRGGFELTDWTQKENYALIYDHDERAINWLGHVQNIRLTEGSLIGDLEIWDKPLAEKLLLAGAKLGISARVFGVEDEDGNFMIERFSNFSVVYDPACKNAYINLSKEKKKVELRMRPIELSVTSSEAVAGSEVGGTNTNEKIHYGKKKKKDEELGDEPIGEASDSIVMKGGLKKLEEEIKKEDQLEEPKEEVKEESDEESEDSKEEVKEESKEEPKEEPVEEPKKESEESEELSSKINLVLDELKNLSERVAKLEEVKEESDEESEDSKEEKLSSKKDVNPLSTVDLAKTPKGYSKGDSEIVEMLLNQAKLK